MTYDNTLLCTVCQKIINGRYFKTSWGTVCEKCHKLDLQCYSCNRQLDQQTILRLPDNRPICQQCYSQAAFDIDNGLIKKIISILLNWGTIIEKPTSYNTADINTLMKFEEGITSRTVNGQCQTSFIIPHNRHREVTKHQILVLYGLPIEYVIGILGHELFHAWLHENIPANTFNYHDTEWLCDFVGYHLLKQANCHQTWIDKFQYCLKNPLANIRSTLVSLAPTSIVATIKSLAH